MALVTLPFTLTNGTTADADEVQANFNALRDGVNNIDTEQLVDESVTEAKLAPGTGTTVYRRDTSIHWRKPRRSGHDARNRPADAIPKNQGVSALARMIHEQSAATNFMNSPAWRSWTKA